MVRDALTLLSAVTFFFEMLDYLIANNIYLLLDIYKTTWDKF